MGFHFVIFDVSMGVPVCVCVRALGGGGGGVVREGGYQFIIMGYL